MFVPLVALAVLAAAAPAAAQTPEIFSVAINFTDTETYLAGEAAARLAACASIAPEDDQTLKVECVKYFIEPSAVCDAATCTVAGVTVVLADLTFQCSGGSYGDEGSATEVTGTQCLAADEGFQSYVLTSYPTSTCAAPDADTSTNGGYSTNSSGCFESAFCAFTSDPIQNFGDFCPPTDGSTVCCGVGVEAALDVFSGGSFIEGQDGTGEELLAVTRSEVDHVVDLDIVVRYEVDSPSRLKIMVQVPFITDASTLEYGSVNYTVCPSAYLIDFVDPVEHSPKVSTIGAYRGGDTGVHATWLPLTHALTSEKNYDQVGRARTSCANVDFQWNSSITSGPEMFDYPTAAEPFKTVNYGKFMPVDSSVFSQGSSAFQPVGTMWTGAVDADDPTRFWYNTSNFFDLITTYYQCQEYAGSDKVITKSAEEESMTVNGVSYPVETYSWTMSVCQVGYFGPECNSHNPGSTSLYAKACKLVPAAFSITPQTISTATVSPVDSNLVTKSFLHSVSSSTSNCIKNHERAVVVIQLMYFSHSHVLHERAEHDLNSPSGVFGEDAALQKNFNVTTLDQTVSEFVASLDEGTAVDPGVFVLRETEFLIGTEQMVRRKFAVLSKCYYTGHDAAAGTRTNPSAFADAFATGENVFFDLEILLEREEVGNPQINTVNMRLLASKETFELPSVFTLKQSSMTATQYLYGSLKAASEDTGLSEAFFTSNGTSAPTTKRPGDQICSKHQLDADFRTAANLEPNAVGACMVHHPAPAGTFPGATIRYSIGGGAEQTFTYGCRIDASNRWIDVTTATQVEGVYEFPGPPPRLDFSLTHSKVYWMVTLGRLNEAQLTTEFTVANRFGAGLFYHNSTSNSPNNQFSDQLQSDETISAGLSNLGPGCSDALGNMKSACNTVCFDLVRNLLSDPNGNQERKVIVHHISVATVVDETQFPARVTARKLLLETAAVSNPGEGESATAATVGVAEASGSALTSDGSSGEPPAGAPAEAPVEAPVEGPAEAPVEGPAEAPVEGPAEAPVEGPAEAPVEAPAGPPAEAPGAVAVELTTYVKPKDSLALKTAYWTLYGITLALGCVFLFATLVLVRVKGH